jgi:DNA-binding winged helix-turn-helix (wHTH) protein/tetratricopeptide (TPR) repeat protein
MPTLSPVEFTFGPFLLDANLYRLLRAGIDVRLRPGAVRALLVLVRNRGRFVGYDQMIAEAWEGTFVSQHTVDVTIAEIRRSLGEYGHWITRRAKVGICFDIPGTDELIAKGWHLWRFRTREGGERAITCFQQAAEESPDDYRAYAGLSACHLMLGTFGIRPPRQVYPPFIEAHERAVALGGLQPELRCNRAFALHIFEHRPEESEQQFLATLQEKPTLAHAHVRLAMLYGARLRFEEALQMIERGYQADPLLPTLAAIEILVRVWQRDYDNAIAVGRTTVALHPYLQVARCNYADALLLAGRDEEALAQYQRAWLTSPDLPWLRALQAACMARVGESEEAAMIARELHRARRFDYVDAYHMALLHVALGDRSAAEEELARAREENSTSLYAFDVDPRMDALR